MECPPSPKFRNGHAEDESLTPWSSFPHPGSNLFLSDILFRCGRCSDTHVCGVSREKPSPDHQIGAIPFPSLLRSLKGANPFKKNKKPCTCHDPLHAISFHRQLFNSERIRPQHLHQSVPYLTCIIINVITIKVSRVVLQWGSDAAT